MKPRVWHPSPTMMLVFAALAAVPSVQALDAPVVCNAADPEILDDVMTYQVGTDLYVQRLFHTAQGDTIVSSPPLRVDTGMPEIRATLNGPEVGSDASGAYLITYQRVAPDGRWLLATATQECPGDHYADPCWQDGSHWRIAETPNIGTRDSRWTPFTTVGRSPPLVAYLRLLDDMPPPDATGPHRALQWRRLRDGNRQEISAPDPGASFPARWATIQGRLTLVTQVFSGADAFIALVDVASNGLSIITHDHGVVKEPQIWRHPRGGYLLAYRWTDGSGPTPNEIRTHRCTSDCGADNWGAPVMTFDYTDLPGDESARPYVQSPEPFVAGDDRAYITFASGDAEGFANITDGNIWYAEVPQAGAPADYVFHRVNANDYEAARKEPEVHQSGAGPVIFYSQTNRDEDDPNPDPYPQCSGEPAMLLAVPTGLPPLEQ